MPTFAGGLLMDADRAGCVRCGPAGAVGANLGQGLVAKVLPQVPAVADRVILRTPWCRTNRISAQASECPLAPTETKAAHPPAGHTSTGLRETQLPRTSLPRPPQENKSAGQNPCQQAPESPRTPRGASSERCRPEAAAEKARSKAVSRLAVQLESGQSVRRASSRPQARPPALGRLLGRPRRTNSHRRKQTRQ